MERISASKDLFVLYVAMLVTRVGFGAVVVLLPYYLPRAGPVSMGIVLALYPLLEALTATPLGRFCDVRGRRVVFLVSLSAMALMMVMIGLTQDILVISVVHAVEGIAAAGITVATLAMITDLTEVGHRGAGMGLFDFANLGGYAFGFLLGGRLHDSLQSNLGYSFFVTAAFMTAAVAISLVLLKEPPHESGKNTSLNPLKTVDAHTRALLPLWLGVTVLLGIVFYLPTALRRIGVHAFATGSLLFGAVVVVGLGSVGFGALSDRVGRQKVMYIGVAGLLGTMVSLALLSGSSSLAASLISYWYIVAPLGLMSTALVPAILALLGDRSRLNSRGLAMGLYSMMLSLGLALGNLVGGVADASGGLSAILSYGAAIFGLACVVSVALSLLTRAHVQK